MAKVIGYVVGDDGTMRPQYEQEASEVEAENDPFEDSEDPEDPEDPEDGEDGETEEPEPVDYSGWKKAELEAEVDTRNEGLEPDDEGYVLVGGKGNVADLVAALEADDAAQ